jgi:hypothetical protein
MYNDNDFQNKFLIAWNDLTYFKKVGRKTSIKVASVGIASNTETPFAPFR